MGPAAWISKDGVITITAAKEIKLVCGDASLGLNSDGTVTIEGKKTLSASGAQSKLELAAAGATLSGQNAKVSGDTTTEISGGVMVKNQRMTANGRVLGPRLHAAILRSRSRRSWAGQALHR